MPWPLPLQPVGEAPPTLLPPSGRSSNMPNASLPRARGACCSVWNTLPPDSQMADAWLVICGWLECHCLSGALPGPMNNSQSHPRMLPVLLSLWDVSPSGMFSYLLMEYFVGRLPHSTAHLMRGRTLSNSAASRMAPGLVPSRCSINDGGGREGREERGCRALAVLTHLREGLFPPDDVGVTGLGSRQPGAVVEVTFPLRPDERALGLALGAQ